MTRFLAFLALFLVASPATEAASAATFQGIGHLGGLDLSSAFAVSDDGGTVVGSSSGSGRTEAFRWTHDGGLQSLGGLPGVDNANTTAFACSADGSVIVGAIDVPAGPQHAFGWTAHTGLVELPFEDDATESTRLAAVSDDGSVAAGSVGSHASHAAVWTTGNGWSLIPGADNLGDADGISADGSIVVGLYNAGRSFRFDRGTGALQDLGSLTSGGFPTTARDVSADGSLVVGGANTPPRAFRWTQAAGLEALHSDAPSIEGSDAFAVSGDGSVIVGQIGFQRAFIWDEANGLRDLQNLLVDQLGVANLTGWTLERAFDISADGRTIVGDGKNPSGNSEAWIVTLPGETTAIPLPSPLAAGAVLLLLGNGWTRRMMA